MSSLDNINIVLTENEESILSFRYFQLTGAQIAMNQYSRLFDYEYSDEHVNKIVNNLADKHALLSDYVLKLVHDRGHKDLKLQDFTHAYCSGVLNIFIKGLFEVVHE